MADAIFLQKVHPDVGFRSGDRAVAVGIDRSPFGHEQGYAIVHCGARFSAQFFTVGAGVKMQGIGNIIEAGNGVQRGRIHILRPIGCADNDQIIGVDLPDSGNHGLGVGFDGIAPGNLKGLIIYFINNVVVPLVAGGHILKKLYGFLLVVFCVVTVPINDHIHTAGKGSIHYSGHALTVDLRVVKISAHIFHAHSRSYQLGVPVAGEPGNRTGGIERLTTPTRVTPKQAAARQANRLAAA